MDTWTLRAKGPMPWTRVRLYAPFTAGGSFGQPWTDLFVICGTTGEAYYANQNFWRRTKHPKPNVYSTQVGCRTEFGSERVTFGYRFRIQRLELIIFRQYVCLFRNKSLGDQGG